MRAKVFCVCVCVFHVECTAQRSYMYKINGDVRLWINCCSEFKTVLVTGMMPCAKMQSKEWRTDPTIENRTKAAGSVHLD